MITFFDYLPSQNSFKVRTFLKQLSIPHVTKYVSIFEGAGQSLDYRRLNPMGAVPAIELEDGRALAESNAILTYLAEGSSFLPDDRFGRAKVNQWLSFEQDYVQNSIGSLRYWTMTSKLASRSTELVESKRAIGTKALGVLEDQLSTRPFLLGPQCSIADISMYAYASRAEEASISLEPYASLKSWILRVESLPGFDREAHPYSVDPNTARELS